MHRRLAAADRNEARRRLLQERGSKWPVEAAVEIETVGVGLA